MALCKVTARSPDGRESSIEVEARSLNYAAIEYNYRAVGFGSAILVVPDRETAFEVVVGDKAYRTTWGRVLGWASRQAAR